MKTVLLLTNVLNPQSGSGRNASNLRTALGGAGYNVQTVNYDGHLLNFIRELRAAARKAHIICAVDMNPVGIIGFLVTRFLPVKFIVIAQAAYAVAPLHNMKTAALSRFVYRFADAIIAGSLFVAREIESQVPGVQVEVITPGVDMGQFALAEERKVEHPPFLLSVGAVKARKGQAISLRAFAHAKRKITGLRYVIVGSQTDEPQYFKDLKLLAEELNVQADVQFLPSVSDDELRSLYSRAAVFILTSVNIDFHFEGFGMVFLEAAAHGVPSIGTTGNGIADAIKHGETGILVPQNDPESTAQAIIQIVQDEALSRNMSAQAKQFAATQDLRHIGAHYDRVFKKLFN